MKAINLASDNGNLFYRKQGEGQTVVLLHGFGEDSSIWENQILALSNQYKLIIPDLPGSGHSTFIPNANIDTYADCVMDILQNENINTPIILLGHSMGGYITLSFAEKNPKLLKGIGLLHSSSYADTEEKKTGRKKSIEFIEVNGASAFLKTAIPGLFSEEFNKINPSIVETLVIEGNHFSKESLIQYYEAMIARPDRSFVLKAANYPVLFIAGKYDKAVPIEFSLEQSHLPKISYINILNKSAHMGMLEETEKFNAAILHFLENIG